MNSLSNVEEFQTTFLSQYLIELRMQLPQQRMQCGPQQATGSPSSQNWFHKKKEKKYKNRKTT